MASLFSLDVTIIDERLNLTNHGDNYRQLHTTAGDGAIVYHAHIAYYFPAYKERQTTRSEIVNQRMYFCVCISVRFFCVWCTPSARFLSYDWVCFGLGFLCFVYGRLLLNKVGLIGACVKNNMARDGPHA